MTSSETDAPREPHAAADFACPTCGRPAKGTCHCERQWGSWLYAEDVIAVARRRLSSETGLQDGRAHD